MSFAYFTDVDDKTMMINRASVTAVRNGGASSRGAPEVLTFIDTLDGSVHTVRHSMDEVFERLMPRRAMREVTCPHCGKRHWIPPGDDA